MIRREVNGVQWLEFELLADCPIIHACTTRQGGISQGHYSSLNLARSSLDDPSHVRENRRLIHAALNIPKALIGNLCHGNTVTSITAPIHDSPLSDGLSTNVPNIATMMTQADCQAAIFYDPINHAYANIHAGWRGNVQNIYHETVIHMRSHYGSNPADILACISPSLGPENAEFIHYKRELPEHFWEFQIKPHYFDLWAIAEMQLRGAGILQHHIQIACLDTYANEKDFFSYRRGNPCGRQATICCLT